MSKFASIFYWKVGDYYRETTLLNDTKIKLKCDRHIVRSQKEEDDIFRSVQHLEELRCFVYVVYGSKGV